jgi:hypothetical protein
MGTAADLAQVQEGLGAGLWGPVNVVLKKLQGRHWTSEVTGGFSIDGGRFEAQRVM